MESVLSKSRHDEWRRDSAPAAGASKRPGQFRCVVDADLLLRAYRCVGTDDTRPYLQGVYIEPNQDGGAILVATDGHRLIALRDPQGLVEGGAAIVRLKAPMRKNALLSIKETKAPKIVKVVVSGQRAAAILTKFKLPPPGVAETFFDLLASPSGDVTAMQWADTLIDGVFPNWREVARSVKLTQAFAHMPHLFDHKLLAPICAALASDSMPGIRIFCSSDEWNNPALILSEDKEIEGFGLLMGRRGDLPAPPKWSGINIEAARNDTEAAAPPLPARVIWTRVLGLPISLVPVTSSSNNHRAQQ